MCACVHVYVCVCARECVCVCGGGKQVQVSQARPVQWPPGEWRFAQWSGLLRTQDSEGWARAPPALLL